MRRDARDSGASASWWPSGENPLGWRRHALRGSAAPGRRRPLVWTSISGVRGACSRRLAQTRGGGWGTSPAWRRKTADLGPRMAPARPGGGYHARPTAADPQRDGGHGRWRLAGLAPGLWPGRLCTVTPARPASRLGTEGRSPAVTKMHHPSRWWGSQATVSWRPTCALSWRD
jgi:hypothetical protein